MDNSKKKNGAKKVALNGVLLSLTAITLYFASIVPTNKLSLYALSSFFTAVIVIEFGKKSGWIFYIASSLLALILPMDKIGIIPYLVFFGVYGILKSYIEKLNILVLEYVLKLVYFNICLFLAYKFMQKFFVDITNLVFPWWIIVIGLQLVFIIYDYAFTLFVQYYNGKLKRILRI